MKLTSLVPVALTSLALLAGGKGLLGEHPVARAAQIDDLSSDNTAGPEGTYKFDKEAMKTAMKAEIEKMPKDQQVFGELGMAMIEAMDITLEIKSGGKYEMKLSMSTDKDKNEESKSGDWTAEGDKITLKGAEMTCEFDSAKLDCEENGKSTIFKKQ